MNCFEISSTGFITKSKRSTLFTLYSFMRNNLKKSTFLCNLNAFNSLVWKLQNLADQRRTKFRGPTIPDSPLVIWPLPKYCLGQLDTVWAEILSWASRTKVFLTHSLFLINKDELSLYVLSGMMLFLWLLWGTRTLCYSFIRDLWIKSHKCDQCGFVLV